MLPISMVFAGLPYLSRKHLKVARELPSGRFVANKWRAFDSECVALGQLYLRLRRDGVGELRVGADRLIVFAARQRWLGERQ